VRATHQIVYFISMGSQLPEEVGPQLRLERPSEHVAVVVIDAPASATH
jgi:hypothetical protein